MRAALRAVWRLGGALLHGLHGVAVCALVFPFLDPPARMQRVRWWSRRMLHRLGVALEVHGEPAPGPVLVAANHVSWLDILAINAAQPVRFVSKAEVHRWPVLGYLVASGGTLFVERERKRDAMRVVHQMADALRNGDHVAVFPEGTTGLGPEPLPFHANLLQAAVATHAPVQGLVLRFSDARSRFSLAPTYVGDTSLAESLWRVVCTDGLRAHLRWLEPRAGGNADRRALAAALREQIVAALRDAR
jgi:1-acyl-sn-glycerol-3-phosphate acyltransferase